jgi:hypothetical protein
MVFDGFTARRLVYMMLIGAAMMSVRFMARSHIESTGSEKYYSVKNQKLVDRKVIPI